MYNYVHLKDREHLLNDYQPSEKKEKVLLLRGLARSYQGWLGAHEDLSEKYDLICVDFPHVGLSKDEKYLHSIKAISDEVMNVVNHLDLNDFFIIAPSMGSLVTYEIVKQLKPNKIKGIVLIVPNHSGFGLSRLSPKGLKTLSKVLYVSKDKRIDLLKSLLIGKKTDGSEVSHEREQKWTDQFLKDNDELGVKGFLAQAGAASRYIKKDGLNYIRENQIPLRFLVATSDLMIPLKHQKMIYDYVKHKNSALIELKNAGHDFIITHHEEVVQTISNFVDNIDNFERTNFINTEDLPQEKKNSPLKKVAVVSGFVILGLLAKILFKKK